MFLIRQAKPADLDDLHSLAKQTFFINLPPDRDIIAHKIAQSTASFQRLASGKSPAAASKLRASPHLLHDSAAGIRALTSHSDLFLFVLEDVEGRGVVGTSQVIAKMGGPGHPRVFLRLGTMTRRSESLKLEWTHQTANLETDSSGPTEIGGLILNHAFRGHKLRLGRLLSFSRFHLIGLFRRHFAPRVVAEMLGPIDKNGYNPFFEKFTRHFIPRSFAEVYRFSQQSKEFITGLVPPGPIDLSIMDPEVAAAAGAVSDDTLPARRILERLGFASHDQIDPMDGGPHLECATGKIELVRATVRAKTIMAAAKIGGKTAHDSIVSTLDRQGEFRAVQTAATVTPAGRVTVGRDAAAMLLASPTAVGVTRMGE